MPQKKNRGKSAKSKPSDTAAAEEEKRLAEKLKQTQIDDDDYEGDDYDEYDDEGNVIKKEDAKEPEETEKKGYCLIVARSWLQLYQHVLTLRLLNELMEL